MQTESQYQKQNQFMDLESSNEPNQFRTFEKAFSDSISLQEDINNYQLTQCIESAQESQRKQFSQNSFDEKSVSDYKQNSRIIAKKKHKKKEEPDDDYFPMKRKKNEQLGKNFLPNFTKPFLNLLKDELAKNNIKSQVFSKYQKLVALNWKILQEFLYESQLHLPILNILLKNTKLSCLLSKTKEKKIMMEHFKQLRKLKKRLIYILEKKVQGTNGENDQFRYSQKIYPWLNFHGLVDQSF